MSLARDDSNHRCINCGYDLSGLVEGGACPECGLPVERSMRAVRLGDCPHSYVRLLQSGLTIVLVGLLAWVGLYVVMFAAAVVRLNELFWAFEAGKIASSLAIVFGWWKLTRRPPVVLVPQMGRCLRLVLRVSVALFAALALVDVGLNLVFNLGFAFNGNSAVTSIYFEVWRVHTLSSPLVVGLHMIAAARFVRWLARCIPLDRQSRWVGLGAWVLPILYTAGVLCWEHAPLPSLGFHRMAYLLGPVVALVAYWVMLSGLRKHVSFIQLKR